MDNSWLGRQGSNLRITGPKPVALPLGYAPIMDEFNLDILPYYAAGYKHNHCANLYLMV